MFRPRLKMPMLKHLFLLASLPVASPVLTQELPIRPDPHLTPGAVLTTDPATVCVPGYAKTVRHTSGKLKAQVYRAYRIDKKAGHFEVDHLISLELGGADVAANLWPESYDTAPWNAHIKDRLEDRLHALVCAGKMTIEEAPRAIAEDWIAAYQRYVSPEPLARSARR
jgi:hypothetical protein